MPAVGCNRYANRLLAGINKAVLPAWASGKPGYFSGILSLMLLQAQGLRGVCNLYVVCPPPGALYSAPSFFPSAQVETPNCAPQSDLLVYAVERLTYLVGRSGFDGHKREQWR